MPKFVIFLTLSILALSLTGCGNTMHGAGRDMESWGKTLQDTF